MTEFEALVEPHRSLLRLHCYRMLGSSHDSEDMVQETFVRAFRARDTLQDPSLVRAWLHRIATNVCIDELAKRQRRVRGPELGPPSDPGLPPAAATPDEEWIEPCPPAWLHSADPAAQYTLKESVALAFVAALQVLTPAQRAVLLLRDVVGLSAEETAEALDSSVSAANSTLHRARVALETRVGPRANWSPEYGDAFDRGLLERYLRAWQSGDLDAMIALFHEDAIISMPPVPTWIAGRSGIHRFLAGHIQQSLRARVFRAAPTEVSGRPGMAIYRVRDDGRAHLIALEAIEMRDGHIAAIDHFLSQSAYAAFIAAGLAPSIAI